MEFSLSRRNVIFLSKSLKYFIEINLQNKRGSMSTFASDTSKRNLKNWIIALSILLLGLIIAHLGISLFLLSELGTDTFTVFIQGLARTFNLSVGTFHVIILCILLVVMLLTTKGYVKPGTILCAFCGGPIIDFFTWLLGDFINADSTLPWRILGMILGCIIYRHVNSHQKQRWYWP